VSIQAAAAERLIETDPAAAKEALTSIRHVSKDSLEEIRGMIGVLRGNTAERAPISGTDRMQDVVDYLKDAHLEVDYSFQEYHSSDVPTYVDIALFGIAREAATNIIKHAQAEHVIIRLRSTSEKAYLRVEDDGVGVSDMVALTGHGIEGMRERTHLLGGLFEAEARTPQGFVVRVEIPLGRATTQE